jgi:serine/threonine protein kinase
MILLDITNNIKGELTNSSSSILSKDNKTFIIKFVNNYDNVKTTNEIVTKTVLQNQTVELSCTVIKFIGSGSYGKVYKIKIGNKYYALKISENEKPYNFKMRYDSLKNIEQLKKYIINIYVAGNIKCGKYSYFSIMEYGGQSLKSKIPFSSVDEVEFITRQLYNIVYLCAKHRICLTDFKLNNIVIDKDNLRLKLIDLYMDCQSYNPCRNCKIVKTYSTLEIDKIRNILDDDDYYHTYHFIPLAIGLMDLLCKKSASQIILNIANYFDIDLGLKQMIPLIQISCYNNIHDSNKKIKEYEKVYHQKKKLEKKYEFLKDDEFYKSFISSIEVRDSYKNKISSNKLRSIIHYLFSAYPDDRSLEPLKNLLTDISL